MPVLKPLEELMWISRDDRLEELVDRYPAVWKQAGEEITAVAQSGGAAQVNNHALKAKALVEGWQSRIAKSKNDPRVIKSALPWIAKGRMWLLTLDKCYLAAAAGKTTGKVRFNLINGWLIQKLLFKRHLTRKPASLSLCKLLWPLITQRKLLLPLLQDKGIYCFYSKQLISELRHMIAGRSCLEIAAGDGTLSQFLNDTGATVQTTDDHSWSHAISFPESVEKLTARRALMKYQPRVVICSWPPYNNNFERHVFATKSVELYIAIGSRFKYVSGNWDVYTSQQSFEWCEDERLTGMVLPPESGNAVLVFRRRGN